MEFAVELADIAKSYKIGFSQKKNPAVDRLSLGVTSGQIFGLLGPNGAGKTTTIKILLGIVRPDGGSGTILGKPLGDRESHRRLGVLPEQPYFYTFLTAEKGLEFYGKFFGLNGDKLERRTAELLDLVGLKPGSHLTLDKYSKGMLQRFGIAQALVNDPDLVILDEPSSGLDPVGQKEVRDILLHLKESGKTILLSSHQLSEVENICDSVSIMNKGRAVREGVLTDLLTVKGLTGIAFRTDDPLSLAPLKGMTRESSTEDGVSVIQVDEADTYGALEIARSAGLELVSVEPYRHSLEDLFMEVIRESPK
jgi:ABC-2 type transport system ATP-binding protein